MKYFFSLRIDTVIENVQLINSIIGVESNYPQINWGYQIKVNNNGYTNFVDYFLNLLDGKYSELKKIGILNKDISIWLIYEYEEECNLEFNPEDMKKLGDSGVTFCISCYQGG